MSCVGCNDGCFDESVQLAQGPVGPQGAAGGEGSTTISASGTDISVTGTGTSGDPYIINFTGTNGDYNVLETGVAQVDVTGNYAASPNPVISKDIVGSTENINGVGDIIRLEFTIIGDADITGASAASKYYYKITFGGQTVVDTSVSTIFQLSKDISEAHNAAVVSLDLIVSASNTLTPVLNQVSTQGDRSTKVTIPVTIGERMQQQVISAISVSDLSTTNNLKVELQSADSTSNISLMSYKIMKFLKA